MKRQDEGYFDYDVDFDDLLGNGLLDEILYIKDIKQRKIFLTQDITQESIAGIARNIMQFNTEDRDIPPEQRKPILLYIVSNGGEVDSGFELIDVIMASKTPVWTVNLGYLYSMGFLIGLAGHKRYALKNAKFMMHDGTNLIYNSGAKAQDQMEFQKKVEERIREYIFSRSKLTPEEYEGKFRVEWYMFADEAKEKGFVDYIIGVDCDLDTVV